MRAPPSQHVLPCPANAVGMDARRRGCRPASNGLPEAVQHPAGECKGALACPSLSGSRTGMLLAMCTQLPAWAWHGSSMPCVAWACQGSACHAMPCHAMSRHATQCKRAAVPRCLSRGGWPTRCVCAPTGPTCRYSFTASTVRLAGGLPSCPDRSSPAQRWRPWLPCQNRCWLVPWLHKLQRASCHARRRQGPHRPRGHAPAAAVRR